MRQVTIIIIALCTSFVGLFATTNPSDKQILTVIAPSGLSLRSAPGTDSKILDVLTLGEKVRVIPSVETTQAETIEWTTGQWILVESNGVEGYVFDGYLTALPIPTENYELSYSIDLIDALEAWMDINKRLAIEPDTVRKSDGSAKVVYTFQSGETMTTKNHEHFYKLEVLLNDIRIMDAYNLLQSMYVNNSDRKTYVDESIFIEEHEGEISRIKVNTENSIVIDKMPSNQVRISMYSPYTGCSL